MALKETAIIASDSNKIIDIRQNQDNSYCINTEIQSEGGLDICEMVFTGNNSYSTMIEVLEKLYNISEKYIEIALENDNS
jgi:hypothetical protein